MLKIPTPSEILSIIYRLLFKDIVDLFLVLPFPLRRGMIVLAILMFCQAGSELLMILSIRSLGIAPANPAAIASEFPYNFVFFLNPDLFSWASAVPVRFLFLATIFVGFCVILKNLITGWTMRDTAFLSERVSLSIGQELMHLYLNSEYRWHISRASEKALQMMLWRPAVASLLVQQLSALTGIVTCAVLFLGMVVEEPKLTLAIMAIMSSLGVLLYRGLRKGIDREAQASAAAAVEENKVILAATRGIRDVLIYGQQDSFENGFVKSIQSGIKPKIFLQVANSLPTLILETAGFLLIPFTVGLLMYWRESLANIIAAVMLLVLTAWRVLPYLNRGVGQMVAIRSILPMARPVLEFLRELRRNSLTLAAMPKNNFEFNDAIELKNASFVYPESDKEVLKNLNLVIPKGKFIGLIGQSGAGKSTCCNLLSGLCKPTKGEFLVDGRQLGDEELASLKKRIGFVPQAPFLLPGSAAANIAFSEWGKPWDAARVIEACKNAAIDFFPLDEKGILYPIGENGAGLSGGQAQRLSIARALYASPGILIFDEATSALDTGNENLIVSSMEKLRGKITCVIIAHRLSTVRNCDLLYWFEDGHIKASGAPAEILPLYEASFKNCKES